MDIFKNKNLLIAIGLIAVAVIGISVYGKMKVDDPLNEQSEVTTEPTSEELAMTSEQSSESNSSMKNEGDAAPTFDLKDVSGNAISLASLKGERVYVKFWASWCSICLAGMEELDELAANAEDFKVITIVSPDFNGEQSSDDFINWYSGLDYENITVLLDPDGDIAKAYGVRGYPTSAYIGSDGILIKQLPGHVENAKVIESFESIY